MQIKVIDIKEYIGRIADLWITCFPEDDVEYVYYYIKHRLIDNGAYCFACMDSETLVSMINVIPQQTHCNNLSMIIPSGFIVGVCTHPDYRKKGYSRELMNYVCDFFCENKKVSVLQLATQIPEFYSGLGFNTYFRYSYSDYFKKYDKNKIRVITHRDFSSEIADDLLACYNKNAKDGFFVKTKNDIIKMVYLYEEIRIAVTEEGSFDSFVFCDKDYDNVTTHQMVKYLTEEVELKANIENY